MGGFFRSKDKKKNQALENAYNINAANAAAANAATANPDPLTTQLRGIASGFLDDISGKNGAFDVTKVKALQPNVSLYNSAVANREDDTDVGALGFGGDTGNPLALARLKESRAAHTQERASGQLEDAYNRTYANITGQVAPEVIGIDQSRLMGRAGMFNSAQQNALNAWASFKPAPSLFEQLLNSAAAGAGSAATMGMG